MNYQDVLEGNRGLDARLLSDSPPAVQDVENFLDRMQESVGELTSADELDHVFVLFRKWKTLLDSHYGVHCSKSLSVDAFVKSQQPQPQPGT